MVLYYIGLDYAHERQYWYKNCYGDSGIGTAQTAYAHFDAGQAIPKMMAYLSDVTINTGPFTVVRQSNLADKSFFLGHLHAAMDRILWGAIEKPAEDTYYRPPFKHQREILLSFPKAFQGSTHFGDDLVDGTEGSDALLKDMEPVVGSCGTACVFDGYRTIHSGGLVREGERLALQIGFQPARNLPTRWQKIQKNYIDFEGQNNIMGLLQSLRKRLNGRRTGEFKKSASILLGEQKLSLVDVGAAGCLPEPWERWRGLTQVTAFEPDQKAGETWKKDTPGQPIG